MSAEFTPEHPKLELMEKRVAREKKARCEAERILEEKSRDLFHANAALKEAQEELEQKVQALEDERDRIVEMSFLDLLTKLPNRNALMTRLDQQLDIRREDIWIALVNIQHFQHVNASLGQRGGDEVLRVFGARLANIAEQYAGFAARLSGTEFALLFEGDPESIEVTLEEVKMLIEAPIEYGDREIAIELVLAVAGTNLVEPNSEKLRLAADFALAKGRSENGCKLKWYDNEMQAKVARRQSLLVQIRGAMEREEIEPWFQPIVHANDDQKLSVEILARWRERGCLVSPMEFFPLVDELGLRDELDRHLLTSALNKALPWVEAGKVHEVGVNVSPQNLMVQGFAKDIERQVKDANFPPENLVVEVTEESFIENLDLVREQLFALKDIGVSIALDDFGTGYSNLKSLVGLPLSKIKLDRSLIWEMESSHRIVMLVSTLIQWARASDLKVVAEGVETEMQATLLRSLGCNYLQGYLYGRALPPRLLVPRFDLEDGAEPIVEDWMQPRQA